MTAEFTRAELFARGARGGALLLGAGAAAVVLAPSAAADPLSDNDLAYVRLLVGTELLGIDFYTRASAAKKLSPTGQKYLKAALVNDLRVEWVPIPAIYDGERSSFRAAADTIRVLAALLARPTTARPTATPRVAPASTSIR